MYYMYYYPIRMDKQESKKILINLLKKEGIYYSIYRLTKSGQVVLSRLSVKQYNERNIYRQIDSPVYIDLQKNTVKFQDNSEKIITYMSISEWDLYLSLIDYLL